MDGEDPAHQKKIRGRKLINVKLDGMRALSVMDKEAGTATLFSRNGLVIDGFPEVQEFLQEKVLKNLKGSVVFDGELMSPKGFQHSMTLVKKKRRSR